MQNEDLERIADSLTHMVRELGADFLTTGAALGADGDISIMTGADGEIHPNSQEGISLVVHALREEAATGAVKACGICLDVTATLPGTTQPTDAIRILVENPSEAFDVFLPYTILPDGGREYAEPMEFPRTQRVFFPAPQEP